MSGRARLTVCAALATMMAAFSLLPLTDGSGWYIRVLLLVCLQAGIGAGARRIPLARPLTVLVQALVSLIVLTAMFATHQAIGGLLPGPSALRQLGQVLQDGMDDVGNFSIPAPVTPGIRLLLIGGVLVVALAVDAIAVTYNTAAPAGLPLLALYSVAAGLYDGGSAWPYFLIAAAGYLVLLLAEGRDRLSRWGRVFGGPPAAGGWGGSSSGGSATAPVRTGRRIGAMALGIALIAPAVLPSLGGGLVDTNGSGSGSGRGGGGGGSVNLVAALQDNLNQPDNREVLTYRTDATDTAGMYLRIAALDKFDGKAWTPSNRDTEKIPAQLPQPQGMAQDVKFTAVTTQVRADHDYVQGLLPMPFPAMAVQAPGDWKFQPEGRMVIGQGGQTTSDLRYAVTSMQVAPTAAQLADAPPATGRIAREYTEVPKSLPPVVAQTARTVTRSATNDYQRAVDLQRYFTSGQFVYNTEAKAGTGVDAIARFLQTKEGFCVHFAFTMAAMSRTLGIPARVAIGFTPGTPTSNGMMSVGLKDAHAWPELYFEGIGWTRFEPTPYRGTPPTYTQESTTGGGDNSQDTAPHGSTSAPSVAPQNTNSCAPVNRGVGDCGAAAATTGGGNGNGGNGSLVRISLYGLLGLLLLSIPAAPVLWRTRLRARRLGGGRGRPEGLTLSAWREVLDTGWDYGVLPDESETPRRAMARLVADGGLTGESADAARKLATAVEETLYAPLPRPAAGLGTEVHRVRAGLHTAASRRVRWRATLLPRSSARLAWAFSTWWNDLTQSVSASTRRLLAHLPRPLRRA
jgi:transglutaminase-like putative cysteine protease